MPTDERVQRRRAEVRQWYTEARHRFRRTEELVTPRVQRALREAHLHDVQVESRTKTVDSVAAKAATLVDGELKYADPRHQITDYVGIRLLVPLVTDLPPVEKLVRGLFVVVESSDSRPDDDPDVPGYRGLHLLVRLKASDREDVDLRDLGDPVIEIQLRTILQHAWAALQHDLLYKSERTPAPGVRRRLVALAGLLELAEREFVQVRREHGTDPRLDPGPGTTTSTGWVAQAVRQLLGEDEPTDPDWVDSLGEVLAELQLTSAEELVAALGPWAGRAEAAAAEIRAGAPWMGPEYVVDRLLRLALGEVYLERRAPGGQDDATRHRFEHEVAGLRAALETSGETP